MQVATLQAGKIELTGTGLALAIVAIIPGVVAAGTDLFLKAPATIQVESAKLDLEREKTATALFQGALANTDPAKRKELLVFLIDVGALNDKNNFIRTLPAAQIPQWTPTASAGGP